MAKPLIEVFVQIDSQQIVELDAANGHVKMIPFSGNVQGELFNGIVEPCGVDTQITGKDGVCHMSARYMMTGSDADGNACHLYVENNAWFSDGKWHDPFDTIPSFMTDSRKLDSYLSGRHFVGQGSTDEHGLWIRFYEAERAEGE